ncbi:uncharacterized protein EDB91DRAFT_1078998 [Suillus paluster]|uniref:uncharacterized protein n=1 Tax=Suillus paluster TaxID=48578 RepID=UPI001B868DE0|nr:uncharacterized protein EDB91DRAFT_1078998 [Suillus paluster]KAG1748860.1 hypothetical protein EDB91DRAFT_1078998 [Suillus paluster]
MYPGWDWERSQMGTRDSPNTAFRVGQDIPEHRKTKLRVSLPEEHRLIALPDLREGTFYRVSSSGDRTVISRREFKRWAHWCKTKREQLPSAHHTEFSQNEGELSPAHAVEEIVPDHSTHETLPTALSQKALDLANSFLSSIIAEPTARTKADPPGSALSLLALLQLLRPRGIVESWAINDPPNTNNSPFHPHPYPNHFLSCFNLQNPWYWDAYTLRVTQLLKKLFAYHFLSLGGILWRLALQFGPADLIAQALAGCSSYATAWQSGDMSDRLCNDIVSFSVAITQERSLVGPLMISGMHPFSGKGPGQTIMSRGSNHTSPVSQLLTMTPPKTTKNGESTSSWLQQPYQIIQPIAGLTLSLVTCSANWGTLEIATPAGTWHNTMLSTVQIAALDLEGSCQPIALTPVCKFANLWRDGLLTELSSGSLVLFPVHRLAEFLRFTDSVRKLANIEQSNFYRQACFCKFLREVTQMIPNTHFSGRKFVQVLEIGRLNRQNNTKREGGFNIAHKFSIRDHIRQTTNLMYISCATIYRGVLTYPSTDWQIYRQLRNQLYSTRDAAGDTPPESPPSSSESQTASPSSDSVPLPGTLTLTFLAAALSNASLEGAPPGISPSTQAATSTGEVPVQSGKKKRGLTNPNNLFKPSSGSTTARNLCGIEWQAQRKMGTVTEFTTHWNSLTPQQREPYVTRLKLADTANLLASSISLASDDSALNAGNSISHVRQVDH